MTKLSTKYLKSAEQLAKAIDIAEGILTKSKSVDSTTRDYFIKWGSEMKHMALKPAPPFNKVASLKYIENDFLIYWNEGSGPDVELFWKEIYTKGLDFERKDTIRVVLKRQKIKDIHEYNNIVDNIVVAEQTGRVNKAQAVKLGELIGEFEDRNT
ncbi:MAG: hypothetical protein HRT74_12535 [Flavobacteriales bacterium]|nr:hypothetical protein [Flavobacteriales bacterium]